MKDGTPLPAALSGNMIERLIRVDEALIYLVSGALSYLVNREQFEQTGALTAQNARNALSDMFTTYFEDVPMVSSTPVGGIMFWLDDPVPDRWLWCDGGAVLKADYPELYAHWGGKYGETTDYFTLPDMKYRSAYGAANNVQLDMTAGSETHTLIVNEMPSHTHAPNSPFTGLIGQRPSGSITAPAGASFAGGATLANTGGGLPHNNLHPVYYGYWIVYAGQP